MGLLLEEPIHPLAEMSVERSFAHVRVHVHYVWIDVVEKVCGNQYSYPPFQCVCDQNHFVDMKVESANRVSDGGGLLVVGTYVAVTAAVEA